MDTTTHRIDPDDDATWDVVVVGGGSAGLSAALMLVRARRRVVVLDAAAPRNRFAPHMHGVLGHDGRSPLALLAAGRDEVTSYGGEIRTVDVVHARRTEGGLEVRTADGAMLKTRRLVVATGLRDELPDVPGLAESWGRGVVVCPYCDGWESRDARIGVLATGERSVHQVQLVRQWSATVTYLTDAVGIADDATRRELDARGIDVLEGPVERVVERDGELDVVLAGGRHVVVDRLFTAPDPVPRDEVLRELGAERRDTPVGSFVAVDPTGRTSVEGVWAVGNVVDPGATVPVAMAAGTLAGGMVNHDLVLEDVRDAVAAAAPAG
ncbi:NAD(P)/FAD-dependent oxidoreductase [Cellulomonas carbonis]|uniref:Thioredoxin reductase n=1 Tax=Cellulomonas carbonis T26 TaxID=947969 RepID=A0A0A0BKT1_9CELL|nr:NAD(P)/FAD-dependent oxidoreductase [Cellulomonas carbonis]KGM08601.1 thioredoxin reductase [Cellulomonas carbonis T26]GGC13692.1 thioredoxin reductase [Cellulomonas carbonis]